MDPQRYTGPLRGIVQELVELRTMVALVALKGVDFASDTSAERAADMIHDGDLHPAALVGATGSGKGGSLTVADLESIAAGEGPGSAEEEEDEEEDEEEG
ncbi:MAG: hypothetical protein GWM92_15805 [Gemmatimonadetes bacterium]|nr:hypothetical protein [Gemmatimonadota bacterium]NIR80197.1 hypothetical protein [Gemmatimonadota bacterium]NIT88959.1 hypothetical protein [Gemmatimonadota bacterium]NIU32754.1 hypothetical protein [Gemmatimonadota bacterium]NIU37186.1 hypothetical protein [Gemmatimonadota bacterium]